MKRVYLNEFNILMGNTTYLPLVSGLLRAFAETRETIIKNYKFMPYLFQYAFPVHQVQAWIFVLLRIEWVKGFQLFPAIL